MEQDKSKIAFCMPYGTYDLGWKIVWQNRKNKKQTGMLVKKKFINREAAQEKLEQIAEMKGWSRAFS